MSQLIETRPGEDDRGAASDAKSKHVEVHHVTRVEGHGSVVLDVDNGTVSRIAWQVPEAPRFFEAMVVGKDWQDIQTIVSRICGICSISHSLACIKGVEAALGLEVSEQTDRLRRLAHMSELMQSHVLHIGYLVAPDLLGQPSVVPVAKSHPELVGLVVSLHRLANRWSDLVTGRTTHPIALQPGRMTHLPSAAELIALQHDLETARKSYWRLVEAVGGLLGGLPDFERPTEYVGLVDGFGYAFYDGRIGSSDAQVPLPLDHFEQACNEYVAQDSTAKWTRWHRDAYAVGARARYNLNGQHLSPLGRQVAQAAGLEAHKHNPYYNTVAQLAELGHIMDRGPELIDEILAAGLSPERPKLEPHAGEGVGAVEAPRGILFHRYAFDAKGRCEKANLVIPTNQNHANIQKDMEALAPTIIDRPESEITLLLEMLVRAYDPCVSCSTHFLDVHFVGAKAPSEERD